MNFHGQLPSQFYKKKKIIELYYSAQDWNQENQFLLTFGSSQLHFSSNGTSDSFQFRLNSKNWWGVTIKMVEI